MSRIRSRDIPTLAPRAKAQRGERVPMCASCCEQQFGSVLDPTYVKDAVSCETCGSRTTRTVVKP